MPTAQELQGAQHARKLALHETWLVQQHWDVAAGVWSPANCMPAIRTAHNVRLIAWALTELVPRDNAQSKPVQLEGSIDGAAADSDRRQLRAPRNRYHCFSQEILVRTRIT